MITHIEAEKKKTLGLDKGLYPQLKLMRPLAKPQSALFPAFSKSWPPVFKEPITFSHFWNYFSHATHGSCLPAQHSD